MKRQLKNSTRIIIKIIFFASLLILAACEEKQDSIQTTAVSQTRLSSTKIVTDVAGKSDNFEVSKQNIPAGSGLHEQNRLRGSSLLINACLFGKIEMDTPWFLSLLKNVLLR